MNTKQEFSAKRRLKLKNAAIKAWKNAYAPYSLFHVGAAVMSNSGNIYGGCNVENASFGGTICAERNAINAAIAAGEKELLAILIYTKTDKPTPPCGICRQVIAEFRIELVLSCTNNENNALWTLNELLPHRFEAKELKIRN